jgi:hypothetical protein
MKKSLLLFLFLIYSVSSFSQGKEGVIKVRKKLSSIPTIAGLAGGTIEGSLLCAGEGIVINKNMQVTSFVFLTDYGSKEISIKHQGNTFNKDACELIALLKSGAEVYINEIAVTDNKGRQSLTTPMRFMIK